MRCITIYYPLKFKPIYKQVIWGGDKLNKLYNRELPFSNVGESWDVSCRKDDMGIIANGIFKERSIKDILYGNPKEYLGSKFDVNSEFPLLIKLIDANDNLSVQVHPDDIFAQEVEKYNFGKTEIWYILDAPKDSFLILGIKDNISKEDFKNAVDENNIESCLNKLYVKKGDVVNIPAGLVHAITKGVVLAEIQQNSDITYRIYDYNRKGIDGKPRELHIDKALDVINFDKTQNPIKGITVSSTCNNMTYYIANKYFAVIKYEVNGCFEEASDEEKFYIFTCVEGNCSIEGKDYKESLETGDSIFIPALLGEYSIVGKCTLLKSFVPDVKKDFINPLLERSISMDEIKLNTYFEM